MLAKKLSSVLNIINRQNQYITNSEKKCQNFKSEVIINQGAVIDLQYAADKTTVADIVEYKRCFTVQQIAKSAQQTLTKSFSDIVKSSNVPNTCTLVRLSPIFKDTLKSVAKQIVVEEKLRKNVVMFRLQEEEDKELSSKFKQVFQSLGKKPSFEAARLGKKFRSCVWPVKASLSSSVTVQQILKNPACYAKLSSSRQCFCR